MTIGERLKEERQRLGMSQTELAEQCGVSKNTQLAYEKGERSPDAAYLLRASLLGADVLYVITGRRQPAELESLSQEELDVLRYMKSMEEEDRIAYLRVGRGISESTESRRTSK
ncbi:TPA: helix-turn-helix transcriptional regulator [Pseudomonas aeruginosa]|uniref:XRE family transcriptional regulator n=5 Tax=root TaxID=1 RepID=A0A3G8F178_9CAUD|nr:MULTISPECIES: helix-turn-helix transcriptional regulator [Pseudomonas]YP_009816635.1 helix-turn-helix domain-containing protein [Pseudomonas phage Dobby]RXK31099.1 transcriptional regulator [Bacillus velezensis]UWJ97846.1 helix-turn-helix domain-containing protein [Pseudomonas aeruginosa TBCF10839]DBA08213.1 TPA_asm: putative transcriptional regulator [Pseudomonas phage vB_PaeM-D14A]ARI94463.1 transcriptional regulator [Pseudomonas aeruginosa]ARJ01000.1 transcriptional regulator [Pseudomon